MYQVTFNALQQVKKYQHKNDALKCFHMNRLYNPLLMQLIFTVHHKAVLLKLNY